MNKDNILFGVVGLLVGLIIGFMGANSLNRTAMNQAGPNQAAVQPGNLPPDHPDIAGQTNPQAMADVQAAVDSANKNPDSFEAQTKAAELYYRIQRYDDAIKYLESANKIKPDAYEVIVQLGNAHFDASRFKEAEKWYEKALATKADDVNVRTDLGLTFIFRTPPDYDRAIREFLGSLQRDPNHRQTLQNLTVAYTKKGDKQKATETLQKLTAVDPSNAAIPRLKEEISKTGVSSS